jgi:hypothetical protein
LLFQVFLPPRFSVWIASFACLWNFSFSTILLSGESYCSEGSRRGWSFVGSVPLRRTVEVPGHFFFGLCQGRFLWLERNSSFCSKMSRVSSGLSKDSVLTYLSTLLPFQAIPVRKFLPSPLFSGHYNGLSAFPVIKSAYSKNDCLKWFPRGPN